MSLYAWSEWNPQAVRAQSITRSPDMRIGLDLDNTIVCYDEVFQFIAKDLGLVSETWKGGKSRVRSELWSRPGGELAWQRLQGQAYGKYMHRATLFPGVGNFLIRTKVRGDKVFIVSHKTEFGHHDSEQIPLRREALHWMCNHRFFDQTGFGLSEEDVFFESSRKAKIRKIAELDCDIFIDDLREVFAEPSFPDSTRKILFGKQKVETDDAYKFTLISTSWRDISEDLLNPESDAEIKAQIDFAARGPTESWSPVEGRANSRVFKVEQGSHTFAAKFYPDVALDPRDRLGAEAIACEFLETQGCSSSLRVVCTAPELNVGLYEWIEGIKVADVRDSDIQQALEFVKMLHRACDTASAAQLPFASEACLSEKDIWNQIERKRCKLNQVLDKSPELGKFLLEQFDPFLTELRVVSRSLFPHRDRFVRLPVRHQTLSASDFGFHNAIRKPDNSLKWIDFEYFGWDDPVKLMADFVWHPGFELSESQILRWQNGCMAIFSKDSDLPDRFRQHFPLYGMRWCLILLNTFFQSEIEQHSMGQARLEKARSYLLAVQEIFSAAGNPAQER